MSAARALRSWSGCSRGRFTLAKTPQEKQRKSIILARVVNAVSRCGGAGDRTKNDDEV